MKLRHKMIMFATGVTGLGLVYALSLFAIVGFLSFGVVSAISQNAGQTLSTLISTDLIQVYRSGTAAITYASPAQITSQSGYYKSAPATGFTFTFGNSQTSAALRPSGTLSTGTVTLAPSPSDGARECIFSTQTITTLTVNASAGQTIDDAVTTLAANTEACYLYSLSNTTWDRD